eukprot:1698062-Rhodomonas_salina.1
MAALPLFMAALPLFMAALPLFMAAMTLFMDSVPLFMDAVPLYIDAAPPPFTDAAPIFAAPAVARGLTVLWHVIGPHITWRWHRTSRYLTVLWHVIYSGDQVRLRSRPPVLLRACYAVSGTERKLYCIFLRIRYGMCGTEQGRVLAQG